MLIPLKHDNMTARRWPVITIGLIVINVLAFLATQGIMEQEAPELGQVKAHILLLAARHPDLHLSPEEQKLVDDFRKQNDSAFRQAQDFNAPVMDGWDAKMRLEDDPDKIQAQMDSLAQRYTELLNSSFEERYAFVPAHPTPMSYLTASFLHGGWLHLIGNMWFLWLAGFVLEDNWGRPLYSVFYLVAGAAALQIHAMANPGSIVPTVGASGAVAALMGAFLVRFPKMKIHMAWLFGFRLYRFKAEAYWLLPLWLLMEVVYGTLLGNASGVAHWAHVGGFIFGAVTAIALKYSGLEKKAAAGVDEKLNPEGTLEIDQANECLQRGQLDDALNLVNGVLATRPDSVDALIVQREVYLRRGQAAEYQDVSTKLIAFYLKKQTPEAALHVYDELTGGGGVNPPAAIWLSLVRGIEQSEMFDRALSEYEKLAAAYPTSPQSIMAQLGAARICLKKLNRPQDALKFFLAADSSPVPHLDVEQSIQMGIKEAKATLQGPTLQPQLAKTLA